jgi:hypothetical protein
MELTENSGRETGSLEDYRRILVDSIVHRTVADLAHEKGITPEARRRWSRLVKRAEKTASTFQKALPAVSAISEIEIAGLRVPVKPPVRIPISRDEAEPNAEGPKL